MPVIDSYSALPVGYKAIELGDETEFSLGDTDEDRFVSIDVQSASVGINLPDATEENRGDTFWVAESGGRGILIMNDENMTVIESATLAAFVSRGTHWECISSGLPWS